MERLNGMYRTVKTTICNGQRINYETGEYEDYTTSLVGHFDAKKATEKVQRLEGDRSISVNNVEHHSERLGLTYNEFLKYAHPID